MRWWVAVLVGLSSSCSGRPKETVICDPPFLSLAEPTAIEYTGGRLYVAATWYLREDPCDRGAIGAAVYRIDPITRSIEAQTLEIATGEGFVAGGQFHLLSESRSSLITIPVAGPLDPGVASLPGLADDVLTASGRGFIAVETADQIVVVGTAAVAGFTASAPAGLAILDGALWSNGTTISRFDLVSLDEAAQYPPPCSSQGPVAAIGSALVVQCGDGGAIALSSTGGIIATISGARFTRMDGSQGHEIGFVSSDYETRMLTSTGGVLAPVVVGVLEDRVEYRTPGEALLVADGLASRISLPAGDQEALVFSEFAQLVMTTDLVAVSTGTITDYELFVYLLDPETLLVEDQLSLPPPEGFFYEE